MTKITTESVECDVRAWTFDGRRVAVRVDSRIFTHHVTARAAYMLMDVAWMFIYSDASELVVIILPKDPTAETDLIVKEFGNALIDAKVRLEVQEATIAIHEAIVAEAFAPVSGG